MGNQYIKESILLILLLAFILMSCTQSQEIENRIEFEGSAQILSGKTFGEDIYEKVLVLFIEEHLLVTTNNEPFFHVFSDDSLVAKFGKKGQGPGEYIFTPRIENFISLNDSIYSIVYNEESKQVNIINYTSSVAKQENSVSECFTLPDELNHGLIDLFFYKENKFVGEFEDRMAKNVDEKTGVFLYDRQAEALKFGELFNYYTEPFHLMTELNVNTRFTTVSQVNEKMAVATLYYPSLEITDINDLSSRKRYLLEDTPPLDGFTQEAYEMEELNHYVLDITSTENALYLLYVDNDYPAEEKQRMVKVIDWGGNPIEQYFLPQDHKVDKITIHSSGKTLVGVSWDQDALYRYEL